VLLTIITNIFELGFFGNVKYFLLKSYRFIMEVKTDTKEKFHVIGVLTPQLTANMTDDVNLRLIDYLKSDPKNVVLNLKEVKAIDEEAAETLVRVQQKFYESNASFVICELTPEVEAFLDEKELLEMMNVTPTESEASDIVQMEEIERDLLGEDDF
jgi:anti-anti-sigma regulatory factor